MIWPEVAVIDIDDPGERINLLWIEVTFCHELVLHVGELQNELAVLQQNASRVYEGVANLIEASADVDREELTTEDIDGLLRLNRRLRSVDEFIGSRVLELRPALEQKLADPKDPMIDYEIDVQIFYYLSEDDPEAGPCRTIFAGLLAKRFDHSEHSC